MLVGGDSLPPFLVFHPGEKHVGIFCPRLDMQFVFIISCVQANMVMTVDAHSGEHGSQLGQHVDGDVHG